jgi:hypothetical protein
LVRREAVLLRVAGEDPLALVALAASLDEPTESVTLAAPAFAASWSLCATTGACSLTVVTTDSLAASTRVCTGSLDQTWSARRRSCS